MRRGIREMDLILIAFADAKLDQMDDRDLNCYESLLDENDQDLYQWLTGQVNAPEQLETMIKEISQTFQK